MPSVSGEHQETDGILNSLLMDSTLRLWIMLGHNVSDEQGMLEMADRFRSIAPELHVQLFRSGEPFWVPK
jgi:hypothetical protein